MEHDHTINGISICSQDKAGHQIKIDPKNTIQIYNSNGDVIVMVEMKNGITEQVSVKRKGKWEILEWVKHAQTIQ